MSKGQTLQDPFLNSLRKDRIPVSIFLVNGIKLQGQIESFDQYVVLLRNTVSQMVYKHAISTVVPARNPRTTGLTGSTGFGHSSGMAGGYEQGQGFGSIPRGTLGNDRTGGFASSDDSDEFGYDSPRGFAQDRGQEKLHDTRTESGFSRDSYSQDRFSSEGYTTDKGFGSQTSFDSTGFSGQGFDGTGFGNSRNFSNDRGFQDTPIPPKSTEEDDKF